MLKIELGRQKLPMTGRARAGLIGGILGVIGLVIGVAAAIWT